ncbi:MAG: hypothetical protein ACI4B3_00940 [Prevotella sp.]
MKRHFLSLLLLCFSSTHIAAQNEQKPFVGYFFNDEYNIYLKIDLHGEGIEIPEHEMFGLLPGYLGKKNNNFYWIVTSSKIKSKKTANMEMINDYGSEDLTVSLTMKNDSIFVLKHQNGSDLKVPNKGKWQKLPSEITLKKK